MIDQANAHEASEALIQSSPSLLSKYNSYVYNENTGEENHINILEENISPQNSVMHMGHPPDSTDWLSTIQPSYTGNSSVGQSSFEDKWCKVWLKKKALLVLMSRKDDSA